MLQRRWTISAAGVQTPWGFLAGAKVKVRPSRDPYDELRLEPRLIRRLGPVFNKHTFGPSLKQRKTLPLPRVEYTAIAGEKLYSVAEVAASYALRESQVREMFFGAIVDAIPAGAINKLFEIK